MHLITDKYSDDAIDIPDEDWIAEGCSNGWVLLITNKRTRCRAAVLAAVQEAPPVLPVCPRIERMSLDESVGFWHVYRDCALKRMWP
jgi:hypothetical protein